MTGEDLPEVEIVETDVVEENGEGDVPSPTPGDLGIDVPEDRDEAVAALTAHIAEARSQAENHLDDLRRVAAEFDNFRKRSVRDRDAMVASASERVVRSMLPVLDSFDAALAIEPSTEPERKMLGGMRSTYDQLMDVLAKEGLEPIEAAGARFDPELHEAVMSSGEGDLVVSQELRRGYLLGGRVLRAALVALESE
ncbi:MAG: nucleotide exchange factor GrpE [Acidimicrobiia bacterium]|nr:nucleotide exchange factor GrpE [Acidimicrobiia bacterium]